MMSDFDNNTSTAAERNRPPANEALEQKARRSLLLALFVPFGFVLATVLVLLFVVEATLLMWLTVPAVAFFIGTFAAMSVILMPGSRQMASMVNGEHHPERVGESLAKALASGNIAKRANAAAPTNTSSESDRAEDRLPGHPPSELTQDDTHDA